MIAELNYFVYMKSIQSIHVVALFCFIQDLYSIFKRTTRVTYFHDVMGTLSIFYLSKVLHKFLTAKVMCASQREAIKYEYT